MISSCNAIIIKSIDFKESSKIITVLSDEYGKFALIAKGAKKPKSKFAGSLQVGDVAKLHYSFKSTRNIQLLTDVDTLQRTYSIHQDFEKLGLLMRSIEMCDILTHEHEKVAEMYQFLSHFISWLAKTDLSVDQLFPYMLIRYAALLGLQLQAMPELITDQDVFFSVDEGMISNEPSAGLSYKLTDGQKLYVILAMSGKSKALTRIDISDHDVHQLTYHLDVYFKHHIDGIRDRRSDQIFNLMNN